MLCVLFLTQGSIQHVFLLMKHKMRCLAECPWFFIHMKINGDWRRQVCHKAIGIGYIHCYVSCIMRHTETNVV